MIQEFSERMLNELEEGLRDLELRQDRALVYGREQSLLMVRSFSALGDFRRVHPFDDVPAEVNYHKFIFPELYALRFYTQQHWEVLKGLPLTGLKAKRKYYGDWLRRIADFFAAYSFFYDYHLGGSVLLDEVFYLDGDPFNVLQPVVPGYEAGLSTAMGHLLGMFSAYERLRSELLTDVYRLEERPALSASVVSPHGELATQVHWTGEVINLIELAHGIYLTGQVDRSKLGIVNFFKALGLFFGVNLRIPKRGFDDMKKRKTMSKTHFCDLMTRSILQKMDDEDAYDPDRESRRNGFL